VGRPSRRPIAVVPAPKGKHSPNSIHTSMVACRGNATVREKPIMRDIALQYEDVGVGSCRLSKASPSGVNDCANPSMSNGGKDYLYHKPLLHVWTCQSSLQDPV
jgi:hypothetical protein